MKYQSHFKVGRKKSQLVHDIKYQLNYKYDYLSNVVNAKYPISYYTSSWMKITKSKKKKKVVVRIINIPKIDNYVKTPRFGIDERSSTAIITHTSIATNH